MEHGEGPVWWPGWGGLRYLDMLAGDVISLSADGSISRRNHGNVVACIRPRTAGGAVIAVERGFVIDPEDGTPAQALGDLWGDPSKRMNEGGCDPDGRFYAGTTSYTGEVGNGALYRLDSSGLVTNVVQDVSVSNGIDWSPDGETAYYIDSKAGSIDAFDYASDAGLTRRRRLVAVPSETGTPDGLTVDAEGRLWVAMWGGGSVHCFSPRGELLEIVALPCAQVTACCFGGQLLDELIITTSRYRLPATGDTASGGLFVARPGVVGRLTLPYG